MTEISPIGDEEEERGTSKTRYYTPDDVAMHNCAEDCWLSIFGQVIEWFWPCSGRQYHQMCCCVCISKSKFGLATHERDVR